jgi:two-component system, sensor histidine kinase and response regulator
VSNIKDERLVMMKFIKRHLKSVLTWLDRLPISQTIPLSWVAALGVGVIFTLTFSLAATMTWRNGVERAETDARRLGRTVLAEMLVLAERTSGSDTSTAAELLVHAATDQRLKYVAIVHPDGAVVVSTRTAHVNKPVASVLVADYVRRLESATSGSAFEWSNEADRTLSYFQKFNWISPQNPDRAHTQGTILVVIDTGKAIEAARRQVLSDQGGMALVMMVTTVLLFVLLFRSLVQPLGVLRQGVRQLGAGQLQISLPPFRVVELHELGQAFNEMSRHLKNRIHEIESSESRLRALINSAPDAILSVNQRLLIVSANPAAAKLFGYEPAEMEGNPLTSLMPASVHALHNQHMRGFADDSHGASSRSMLLGRVVHGLHKDGHALNLEIGISRSGGGEDALFTAVIRDVSERMRLEQEIASHRDQLEEEVALRTRELKEQRDRAEIATRAKSEFLANMSHEIRTPMNAVIGMAHLARRAAINPTQITYLEKLGEAAQHLLGVLNDILDFSKIEAGKLDISHRPFEFHRVVDQVCQMLSEKAARKNLEVVEWMDADVPTHVIGDDLRLRQVLFNLIGNAVKFTEAGHITVRVRRTHFAPAPYCGLRVEITDTGIGIPSEALHRLFQPFEQADQSTTRRYGGTGLGLAISRRLVQLMGGELTARSVQGVGSTFSFELALRVAEGDWGGQSAPLSLTQQRFLVVDDNDDARTALVDDLKMLGLDALGAAKASECLRALENAEQEGRPFEACILDWRMPEIDGMELARRIQSLEINTPPRLLLASAYGSHLPTQSVMDAGFCGVIAKPVALMHLREQLLDALQPISSNTFTNSKTSGFLYPDINKFSWSLHLGRKILVAEDNLLNQEVAAQLLLDIGLEPLIANDGFEALRLLKGCQDIALVLMDVHMPWMDGIESTKSIRQMEQWRHLPIIAMTASVLDEDRQSCADAGMNGFIPKPVDPDQFYAVLWEWLPREQAPPPLPTPLTHALSDSAQVLDDAVLISHWGRVMGLRVDAGLKTVRGNLGTYGRLITRFVESHGSDAQRLRQASSDGAWDNVKSTAHVLKSTAGSIGALQLASTATEIQALGETATEQQRERLALQLAQEVELLHKDLERALHQMPQVPGIREQRVVCTENQSALQAELVQYLTERDMAAVRFVREHETCLRENLGDMASPLIAAVRRFDYDTALQIVRQNAIH